MPAGTAAARLERPEAGDERHRHAVGALIGEPGGGDHNQTAGLADGSRVDSIVGWLDDASSQAVSALLNTTPEFVKHEGYITEAATPVSPR